MRGMFTPLEEAQYTLVHEFPGGAVALAARAGMNAGTLSNKVNPAVETHKLSVAEAVALQNVAKDCRILHAEAAALDHVAVQLADYSHVGDLELLNCYAKVHQELGDMAQAISRAFADKRITKSELGEITREMDETVRALFELRARLEALADE